MEYGVVHIETENKETQKKTEKQKTEKEQKPGDIPQSPQVTSGHALGISLHAVSFQGQGVRLGKISVN